MESQAKSLTRKLAVALGFAGMVVVNGLAMAGKINGINTADVSALYPTLFTPANYAFSIWGTIYLLLLVYVVFQLFVQKPSAENNLAKVAFWFVLSCIVNAGWIFAWHFGQILISAIVMAGLMACLGRILSLTAKPDGTCCGMVSLELPFGLYAGWITVATVANIAVLLTHLGWNGFGVPVVWMIVTLLVAVGVVFAVTGKIRNIAYPAAVLWGFTGILVRYLTDFTFDAHNDAMWIVLTLGLCLLALTARWVEIIVRRLK